MQQYLPFTVLKLIGYRFFFRIDVCPVATVLTVYGIETDTPRSNLTTSPAWSVATVLTVYGIETNLEFHIHRIILLVATVLTVYGIETSTVIFSRIYSKMLQQYLPFTVLKLSPYCREVHPHDCRVATVLTVYGIET